MKKIVNLKTVLLICLIAFSSLLTFTSLALRVKADDYLFGVRGQDYEDLGSGIVSNYIVAYSVIGNDLWEYGVNTLIDSNQVVNQLTLNGPSRGYPILFPPLEPYTQAVNLEWETYGGYRPYVVIRSTDWYDHTFELCETSSSSVTFNYEISLGIKSGYGSASYSEGGSSTTIEAEFTRWEYTVDQAETAIVYFWTTFLRVHGDITFFDDTTINYDVVALQQIDFFNRHLEDYTSEQTIVELPSDLGESCYDQSIPLGIPDKFYSMSDKDSIGWSESQLYSTSWDVSLQIGGEPGPADPWWMGLYLSVDLNWVEAGSQTLEVVHHFTPTNSSRPLDYFYYVIENPFSTNLLAEQNPVATIINPSSGSTLWDIEGVTINGQDNSEVVDARLWVSDNAELNEEADTEIIDPYTIHLDNNWFMGFQTNEFSDGTYYLFAKVYDRFGANGQTFVEVEIDNDGWGQIITPAEGSTKLLGDNIYFSANVYDHSGVDSVQFKVGTSGSWNNAYYNSLLQRWTWVWYDQPSIGTYTVYCREIDTFGRISDIDSVTFHVDYRTIETYLVSPIRYSSYIGGTAEGKYDDNNYYKVRTKSIGWGWHESYTRFYFNSYYELINVMYELQITPCTPIVEVRTKYTDGSRTGWTRLLTNTYSTQSVSLNTAKKVQYIEIHQLVWWHPNQWIYVDFIRILYRIY